MDGGAPGKIVTPAKSKITPGFFDADLVVSKMRDVVAAEALDHEMAVVQPIAVQDNASAKDELSPLSWVNERVQVVIPEMVIGDKNESVSSQPKVHIHGQMPAEP